MISSNATKHLSSKYIPYTIWGILYMLFFITLIQKYRYVLRIALITCSHQVDSFHHHNN